MSNIVPNVFLSIEVSDSQVSVSCVPYLSFQFFTADQPARGDETTVTKIHKNMLVSPIPNHADNSLVANQQHSVDTLH